MEMKPTNSYKDLNVIPIDLDPNKLTNKMQVGIPTYLPMKME
jgi:hypothetical protein